MVEYYREKVCRSRRVAEKQMRAYRARLLHLLALYLAAVALVEAAETRGLPDRQRRRRQGLVHASLSWQNQVAAGDVGKYIAPHGRVLHQKHRMYGMALG